MAAWLAIIPGLGHMVLRRRAKGAHLLAYASGAVLLMIWRSERIADAFGSRALDEWLAALFLIGSLLATTAYSLWDVHRLLESGDAPLASKSRNMCRAS